MRFTLLVLIAVLVGCSPCGVLQICPQPCVDVPCDAKVPK